MIKKIIFSFIILLCISSNLKAFAQTEGEKGFKFAVIGCPHIGICDTKDFELAVEKINAYNPDFIVLLGCLIDPFSGKPRDSLLREFNTITAKLKAPSYYATGNCTLEKNNSSQEKLFLTQENLSQNEAPPRRKREGFSDEILERPDFIRAINGLGVEPRKYKKKYYHFEFNNNLFIILDSDNLITTTTDNDQLVFLRKALQDTSKYENVFIFTGGSSWAQIKTANQWSKTVAPLILNKVNYVFGAGAHYLDLRKNMGINYVSTSAYCWQDTSRKTGFPHFLIVEVDQKSISVKVEPLEGIPIEKLTLHEKPHKTTGNSQKPVIILSHNLESAERTTLLPPDKIIETLNIKPGMNILDIGAGTGLFSFRFANALKGTGHVLAAETDSRLVDYINKTSSITNLSNISGVLVKSKEVDNLIKQQTFDIIFMCEVYHYLGNPGDYFKELKNSLKKETGRLYIIHFKNVSEFSNAEFGDFTNALKILSAEKKDFPILLRLSKENRKFVSEWNEKEIPIQTQNAIIQDLNKILPDTTLYNSLYSYYSKKEEQGNTLLLSNVINIPDIRLFTWLIAELDNNGIFRHEKKSIPEEDITKLKTLNRILLTGILKSELLNNLTTKRIYLWKDSIIRTLKKSGFQYLGERHILTHHHFLEFKRK